MEPIPYSPSMVSSPPLCEPVKVYWQFGRRPKQDARQRSLPHSIQGSGKEAGDKSEPENARSRLIYRPEYPSSSSTWVLSLSRLANLKPKGNGWEGIFEPDKAFMGSHCIQPHGLPAFIRWQVTISWKSSEFGGWRR